MVLVGAVAAGYLVRRNPEERSVLGLGTVQRNISAAIVVAAQNLGHDPEVITMVMVVAVLGLVILFALAAELGKRALKSNPTRVIEES